MTHLRNILIVFGTRPEAIKMGPLCLALKQAEGVEVTVCVSGQHRDMLDSALRLFDLVPDYDLDVMTPGQDLYDVTSRILIGMRDVLEVVQPDLVLVHGDTTTALATSMAAFYGGFKLGHVEAGLRTHNVYAPFPEEFNRKTISSIADFHFVPTEISKTNLTSEGVSSSHIWVTGNTVIDALFLVLEKIDNDTIRRDLIIDGLQKFLDFDFVTQKFILITGHRRENFGEGFVNICEALRHLSVLNQNIKFVYPVHLNPNVKGPVFELLSGMGNVYLIPPLDYEAFIFLLRYSYLVLTDSGGIQEEAPSLGKPVLLMRDATERPEAIAAGTVKLVGSSAHTIVSNVTDLITNKSSYYAMAGAKNPFGNGTACSAIVDVIKGYGN